MTIFEEVYGNWNLIEKIENLIFKATDRIEEIYPLLTDKDRATVSTISDSYFDKNGVIKFKYGKLSDAVKASWKNHGADNPLKCAFEPILNLFNNLDFCKILSISFSAEIDVEDCKAVILVHLCDGTTVDLRDFSILDCLLHHMQKVCFTDTDCYLVLSDGFMIANRNPYYANQKLSDAFYTYYSFIIDSFYLHSEEFQQSYADLQVLLNWVSDECSKLYKK